MFLVLHLLSLFASINTISETTRTCRNIVGRMASGVAKCALWEASILPPKFSTMAVDETCLGKRRNNVGKRSRVANFWFFSATEINPDGTAGRTHWRGTPQRTPPLAEGFVSSVLLRRRCTPVFFRYRHGHVWTLKLGRGRGKTTEITCTTSPKFFLKSWLST